MKQLRKEYDYLTMAELEELTEEYLAEQRMQELAEKNPALSNQELKALSKKSAEAVEFSTRQITARVYSSSAEIWSMARKVRIINTYGFI